MSNRIKERWVFTDKELLNPSPCKSDDEFVTSVTDNDSVVVNRKGQSQNRYLDGIRGITAEHSILAEANDSLVKMGSGWPREFGTEVAETWRDVWTNQAGDFLGFAH